MQHCWYQRMKRKGPIFGLIHEILCCAYDDTKLFVLDIMETDVYNELFNSYEVCMMRTNVADLFQSYRQNVDN